MALQLTIQLFKDPTVEVVQDHISFEMLGELTKKTEELKNIPAKLNDIDTDEQVDKIIEIVCMLFKGKISTTEMKRYADISEIFDCFLALGSLSKRFSQKKNSQTKKREFLNGKKR